MFHFNKEPQGEERCMCGSVAKLLSCSTVAIASVDLFLFFGKWEGDAKQS